MEGVSKRFGHRATLFAECGAMYRASGPEALRPIGETEFATGVAAMSNSGLYGLTRVCAGIVGHADLTLGARVTDVLQAHIAAAGGRFRGIRHSRCVTPVPRFGARCIFRLQGCSGRRIFATASPVLRRSDFPSTPGSATPSFRSLSISFAHSRKQHLSSIITLASSVSAPMLASARRFCGMGPRSAGSSVPSQCQPQDRWNGNAHFRIRLP